MTTKPKQRLEGIEVRHARTCPAITDREAACRCKPSYRAGVYDTRSSSKIRKSFPTLAAAKAWRADSIGDVRRGTLRAAAPVTLRQAADDLVAGMASGAVRNRSGDHYKPSVIRGYEQALRTRLLDELGGRKLSAITRQDVQRLVDGMLAKNLDPSTIKNAIMPLRVIFRRAIEDGIVAVNPAEKLRLPAVRGRRDRIADPTEAAALIAALPEADRPLWATAMYAGLRLGELWALRDEDIDLDAGVIRVERSWDRRAGVIEPKSQAGRRVVPVMMVLRGHLAAARLRNGRPAGLFFGTGSRPFNRDQVVGRAVKAWKAAGLDPIGLHECRHTFASMAIAAGVNVKALSTYLGHASIALTYDRYGHLMPGNEAEAAGLLDAYLERHDKVSDAFGR